MTTSISDRFLAMPRIARLLAAVGTVVLASGCATQQPFDYSAFRESRPASMLVLPPVSDAPDIKATPAVWAQATLPLAEAGYYVYPVPLLDETFRQNGVMTAADIQDISAQRLREIFGADAAVYLRVKRYGTSYAVVMSETRVEVEGRIVDLRTGREIWRGQAMASSAENDSSNQAGLVGLLVKAVVQQIVGTVSDASFNYAGVANGRLLGAPRPNGVLFGPRSPNYRKDVP